MTGELHALECRGSEWRCLCSKGIRAASCQRCQRCGAERPADTATMMALTADAIQALDVFKAGCREHGNETAAMGEVIVWLTGRHRA